MLNGATSKLTHTQYTYRVENKCIDRQLICFLTYICICTQTVDIVTEVMKLHAEMNQSEKSGKTIKVDQLLILAFSSEEEKTIYSPLNSEAGFRDT